MTDPAGGVTQYIYDTSVDHRLLSVKDARGNQNLTNEYDAAGHVTKQIPADNATYLFAYTLDIDGRIVQTDVTHDTAEPLRSCSERLDVSIPPECADPAARGAY